MDDKEHKIRIRAHAIWESEGQPHGAHDDHWRRAEAEHEQTDKEAASSENVHHAERSKVNDGKNPTKTSRGKKV
jgi:hypothetical protein